MSGSKPSREINSHSDLISHEFQDPQTWPVVRVHQVTIPRISQGVITLSTKTWRDTRPVRAQVRGKGIGCAFYSKALLQRGLKTLIHGCQDAIKKR